jgi:prophage maintenance system killer protein
VVLTRITSGDNATNSIAAFYKRTGFYAAEMFLNANGYSLKIADSPILWESLDRLIMKEISEDDFHLAVQDFIEETGQGDPG